MENLNNLTKEDYQQLATYYKNKSVDIEFKFLLLQIENSKIAESEKNKYEEELNKHRENYKTGNENLIMKFNQKIKQLEKQLNDTKKREEKLKNKINNK